MGRNNADKRNSWQLMEQRRVRRNQIIIGVLSVVIILSMLISMIRLG